MAKIAEVRINEKLKLVQIKMNRGRNYTLRGIEFEEFLVDVNQYIERGDSLPIASRNAAIAFLKGSE